LKYNFVYFCFIVFVFLVFFIKYGIGGRALFDYIQTGLASTTHTPKESSFGTTPVLRHPTAGPGIMRVPPTGPMMMPGARSPMMVPGPYGPRGPMMMPGPRSPMMWPRPQAPMMVRHPNNPMPQYYQS
jgi:hypothetical protein